MRWCPRAIKGLVDMVTGKEQQHQKECYWLLSFIDDVNGVCMGSIKEMDRALQGAAEKAGIR